MLSALGKMLGGRNDDAAKTQTSKWKRRKIRTVKISLLFHLEVVNMVDEK